MPKGGEVITTPFTFISTTHAISRNNLTPVFCDINEKDFTIDVTKIESLITEKTVAIVPVHVYGNICNVEEIERIAKKYNLKVIYDAAHAFGINYKKESITKWGDLSMFSFHATKVFNTIEGGALAYKDSEYYNTLNSLKNFGIKDEENIKWIAGNAKMNEFQAAMGICNLENIEKNILDRKKLVQKYRELLKNVEGIQMSELQENVESNYAYFPIIINENFGIDRNKLNDILKQNNIYTRKYFYPISNETECYKNCKGNTPIAKRISEKVLTLPLYSDLGIENVIKICNIIKQSGEKNE